VIFADEQIAELKQLSPELSAGVEGGTTYFLLPLLQLPKHCTPRVVDVLLCPTPQDGYEFRLYFAQQISGRNANNWHVQNRRILERNWYAFSYKTNQHQLRLAQMVNLLMNVL
jgi:hypothetical protein